MEEKQHGVVKTAARNFAFIAPANGSEDVFVHHTAVLGQRPLQIGDRVRYYPQPSTRKPGAWQAAEVELVT